MHDKNFVIFGLMILAVLCVFVPVPPENVTIIDKVVAGCLGMAVGVGVGVKSK